ncbi:uncharacterized protein PAC_18575 [Phialocephala subalpina]|uniref:Glycosyltransferase WbsX n=1 Tax=Phialocephala subalpina TaxID=576137 RepID=A0A1L7XUI0_9HELO|nr:uncharacterized protein PAC_18575 [Phialocephala subalpina]
MDQTNSIVPDQIPKQSETDVFPTPLPLHEWVEVNFPIKANEALDSNTEGAKVNEDYVVAAYYFGNFHVDPRNETAHGKGWTEWQLVREAKPRFPGHEQPKIPLWGYEDESDPKVFEKKIAAASRAFVSAFIFDWYWYNDGPFLEAALEQGYLKAPNRRDVKFAIMWANHDWDDIHPAKLRSPPYLQFPGQIIPDTFDKMTTHIVDHYFSQDSYLKIDGCPYFSIYELYRFVLGMGGSNQAAQELQKFRAKVKAAGFPDLHLNAVTWGVQLLPGEGEAPDLKTLLERLNVDSTTSYVWIHHAQLSTFPVTQYDELATAYETYRSTASEELGKPYFPNVSVGWDSSPRACQSDIYTNATYPFMPVVQGNTPERFGEALRSAKGFLDSSTELKTKLLTINSWNEWTEGSYLEPDVETRFSYLDQVDKVFGKHNG